MIFSKLKYCTRCLLTVSLLVFLTKTVWSQGGNSSKLDNLQNLIERASHDSIKVNLYWEQVKILTYSNPDQAQPIITKALRLAQKLNNVAVFLKSLDLAGQFYYNTSQLDSSLVIYKRSLNLAIESANDSRTSEALIWIGNIYNRMGSYDSALYYHRKNISFCESINDQEGIASSYNNLGNVANARGDYAQSIEYYAQALKTYEKLGSKLSTAIAMANMGMIHNRLENYDKAIGYLKNSDSLFQKLNHHVGTNFVLKNLGISYKNKGDLKKAMRTYRQAQANYEQMDASFELAALHQNIGNVYWEWSNYDSAKINYLESLKYSQVISDSLGIARAYNAIGACYFKDSQFGTSKAYFQKARKIAELSQNPLITMNAEEQLYSVHKILGEYKEAVSSLERFSSIKDSLRSSEKEQIAEEVEAKYQNEKKQKEIALLRARNEINLLNIRKKENELVFLIILTLAALLIGGVLYRLYTINKKSRTKLQELNQLQSSFFANISHEFRTPLTLIMASLDKLKSTETPATAAYNSIDHHSKRLLQLINQLLDLSKLEAGNEKLLVSKVDVNQYMKRLSASFASLAESRSITYEVTIPDESLEGFLDINKIEKVIYNLLSNAFKFTSAGGKVTLTVTTTTESMRVEICDDGVGIAPDDQERIFKRFYQTDKADNRVFDGSGIGLALTGELLELHKGTIDVNSKPDQGSKFMVTVPLTGYQPDEIVSGEVKSVDNVIDPPHLQIGKQDTTEAEVRQAGLVIELVEDNDDLRAYLEELLAPEYTVITAANGACGYNLAQEHIPDLIITDLMMPKVDGKKMIELIRSNEKTCHIPVFMLTAKADRESKLQGLGIGADDYLTKPFDSTELKIKISNVLKTRQKMQERLKAHFFFPDPKLSANDRFVKKASEIVNNNLSNPDFNVEEFNRAMGYSRMQLHRKLKAITGKSTGDFIKSIRMKKALLLLEKDYDQISQIAFETGFSSPSYFSKCFKEIYGVTPKEYVQSDSIDV